MKNRPLAVVLAILLAITLFPTTALAGDYFVGTWADLNNAINSSYIGDAIHVQGDITLDADIVLTNRRLIIQQYASITTGAYSITSSHSISPDGFENNGTINVSNGGSIIIDSGCLLENRSNGTINNDGTINNGGTITNNGTIDNKGTITGNTIGGTAPPSITTTSPIPNGTVNVLYTQMLMADNSPTTWSPSSHPAWMAIDNNGVITGTPTTAGTSNFNIKATNAGGSHTKQFSITVAAVAPGAPAIGTATAGDGQATISFTAPANNGGSPITSYTVTSNPGTITVAGVSSPITVPGLTNGTAYTFTVTATNSAGTGPASAASNSVTPQALPAPSGGGGSWYVPPTTQKPHAPVPTPFPAQGTVTAKRITAYMLDTLKGKATFRLNKNEQFTLLELAENGKALLIEKNDLKGYIAIKDFKAAFDAQLRATATAKKASVYTVQANGKLKRIGYYPNGQVIGINGVDGGYLISKQPSITYYLKTGEWVLAKAPAVRD